MLQWFNSIDVNTLWSVSSTVIAVIAILIAYNHKRQYQKLKQQITQIQNEIRAINSGALGMGRTIKKFANDIANVEISHITENQPDTSEKTYQQAGLLLSRGATIEEVVDACDMSPAEVELIAILRHSGAAA
jgi:uncharacterized protein YydD (DUF2326 family)